MPFVYKGASFDIQYHNEDKCWYAVAKNEHYLLVTDAPTAQELLPQIKEMVDDYILNHFNKREE